MNNAVPEITGVLNINKPRGISSNGIVQKIRRSVNRMKAGYAGTLDPDAMGVLPVCLGKATKIVNYILDKQKTYEVTMRLGVRTDTQDATGHVIREWDGKLPDAKSVKAALKSFIGPIEQVPPMYSALHHKGKRMYKLAREGVQIDRKPRRITIYDIRDARVRKNEVHFFVECSKGTYIRTLCDDVGEKLGCGAHLKTLVRIQSGVFTLEKSLDPEKIPDLFTSGKLHDYLYSMNEILGDLPFVVIMDQYKHQVLNGNSIPEAWLKQGLSVAVPVNNLRILDSSDNLLGLGKIKSERDHSHTQEHMWVNITKLLV